MKMAEEGVQLHGAIAITDEYIAGHYMKRLTAIDRMFGDGDAALDRYLKFRGRFDDVLGLSR
jgi:alkylation response protein AidB-like acyl-CoA dehydrogenase